MVGRSGERAIKRIHEGGIKRAEGELVDNMREVECYTPTHVSNNIPKTS